MKLKRTITRTGAGWRKKQATRLAAFLLALSLGLFFAPKGLWTPNDTAALNLPFVLEAPEYPAVARSNSLAADVDRDLGETQNSIEGGQIEDEDDTAPDTSLRVAVGIPDGMHRFLLAELDDFDAHNEQLTQAGLRDIAVYLQLDWSMDKKNDWHYSAEWDSLEQACPGAEWEYTAIPIGLQSIQQEFVFVMPNQTDEAFRSDEYGWVKVLKDSQYYVDDATHVAIDWSAHTLYLRARFVCEIAETGSKEHSFLASDWTDTVRYTASEEAEEISLSAPEISHLTLTAGATEKEDVLSFELAISDRLRRESILLAARDEEIVPAVSVKIGSRTWEEFDLFATEFIAGTVSVELYYAVDNWYYPAEGTEISLYLTYYTANNVIASPPSETLTVIAGEAAREESKEESSPEESGSEEESGGQKSDADGWWQRFLESRPFGMNPLLFLVVLALLAAGLVILLCLLASARRKARNGSSEQNGGSGETPLTPAEKRRLEQEKHQAEVRKKKWKDVHYTEIKRSATAKKKKNASKPKKQNGKKKKK